MSGLDWADRKLIAAARSARQRAAVARRGAEPPCNHGAYFGGAGGTVARCLICPSASDDNLERHGLGAVRTGQHNNSPVRTPQPGRTS